MVVMHRVCIRSRVPLEVIVVISVFSTRLKLMRMLELLLFKRRHICILLCLPLLNHHQVLRFLRRFQGQVLMPINKTLAIQVYLCIQLIIDGYFHEGLVGLRLVRWRAIQ